VGVTSNKKIREPKGSPLYAVKRAGGTFFHNKQGDCTMTDKVHFVDTVPGCICFHGSTKGIRISLEQYHALAKSGMKGAIPNDECNSWIWTCQLHSARLLGFQPGCGTRVVQEGELSKDESNQLAHIRGLLNTASVMHPTLFKPAVAATAADVVDLLYADRLRAAKALGNPVGLKPVLPTVNPITDGDDRLIARRREGVAVMAAKLEALVFEISQQKKYGWSDDKTRDAYTKLAPAIKLAIKELK
jgi:hypothetical protein